MEAMGVMRASDFLETAIADKRSYGESVTLLTPPKKKVVGAFSGGGCASSDTPPIDFSSSAIDHTVGILKKACSILFDKALSALKDEIKKEEKKEEKYDKDDKNGKRKRDCDSD